MNKFVRFLGAPALALVTGSVYAAVPAEVSTAITTAGTDAATIGAAVLVVLFAIWAFKLMRSAK